jgi:hypothetical protein
MPGRMDRRDGLPVLGGSPYVPVGTPRPIESACASHRGTCFHACLAAGAARAMELARVNGSPGNLAEQDCRSPKCEAGRALRNPRLLAAVEVHRMARARQG